MDATFFSALVRGVLAGDIVNLLAYRVRPNEKAPGSADVALEDCKKLVSDARRNRKSVLVALHRAGRRMAFSSGRWGWLAGEGPLDEPPAARLHKTTEAPSGEWRPPRHLSIRHRRIRRRNRRRSCRRDRRRGR